MPSIPAAAHVVAWVALGTGVGAVLVGQHDVSKRLAALEETRASAPAGSAAAGMDGDKDREIATLQARLEASESRQTDQLTAVRKETAKLWEELLKSPDATAPAAGAPGKQAGFEEAVRGVIDRYAMEHKFREAVQKATAPLVPKKPSFVQLATALKLRPEQAERFGNEIRAIQTELFEILSLPRADGVALLEEIQQADQFPEGNPKRAEIFLKLFKLTIPDTQETYIERAVALATKVKTGTKDYFDVDQSTSLDGLDLDWFGIRMQ